LLTVIVDCCLLFDPMSFFDLFHIFGAFLFDFLFGQVSQFLDRAVFQLLGSFEEGFFCVELGMFDDFRQENVEQSADDRSGRDVAACL